MKIYFNTRPIETEATTLAGFIAQLNLPYDGIAVGLWGKLIEEEDWESTPLKENDRIIIIKASAGG